MKAQEAIKAGLKKHLESLFPEHEISPSGDFKPLKKDRIYFEVELLPSEFSDACGTARLRVIYASVDAFRFDEFNGSVKTEILKASLNMKDDEVYFGLIETKEQLDTQLGDIADGGRFYYKETIFEGKYQEKEE